MPKVKQQTLADALGVSKATVSRCFSNHPGISPETRARVFHKASELGYKPLIPRTRKANSQKSVTRIAMVACVPTGKFGNDQFTDPRAGVLEGINEIALINDWVMDSHFIDPLKADVASELQSLINSSKSQPWDGLLLVYPFPRESLFRLAAKLPCVSVFEQYGNRIPLDCVDVDAHRGIALMVDRLVEAGHQRIGFYSETYPVNPPFVLRRFSAFAERMAYHSLRFDAADTFGVYPDSFGEDRRFLSEVVDRVGDGMTALVCAADHQAYPVISRLHEAGMDVPKDLSITGFDAIPVPSDMPELCSIRVPHKEVGIAAMQRLATLLQLRSFATRHIHIECSGVTGATIGPPAR